MASHVHSYPACVCYMPINRQFRILLRVLVMGRRGDMELMSAARK